MVHTGKVKRRDKGSSGKQLAGDKRLWATWGLSALTRMCSQLSTAILAPILTTVSSPSFPRFSITWKVLVLPLIFVFGHVMNIIIMKSVHLTNS